MTTIIHDPKNHLKIESIWAFISVDEDGNEGLVAAPMPLIAADEERLETLNQFARELSGMTKKEIRLIQLTQRIDLGPVK